MNRLLLIGVVLLIFTASLSAVHAHCPLCTAAVGAGVVVTRFYGVDDAIVGVWIGAFVISLAMWASRSLKKKYVPFQSPILALIMLLATVIPFAFAGLIGNPDYKIFGFDKLLLGILAGSLVAGVAVKVSKRIKEKKGKVFFPFQTMVFVIVSLAITSLIMWGVVSLAV